VHDDRRMAQTVELVLDDDLDHLVRQEWVILRDADLPSQALHTGASKAPHITVGVADGIDGQTEHALRQIDYGAGSPLRLGGLLVFGGRRSVLSRVVIPSDGLLRTHRAVHAAMAGSAGWPDTMLPDRWTPHVTLARRLDDRQLAAALASLHDRPRELAGRIGAARRWDSDARATWDVTDPP
jgi:2'-5' RNA ligase